MTVRPGAALLARPRRQSVVVPVRGSVPEQPVTVIGLLALAPANIGFVRRAVREHRPIVGTRLGSTWGLHDPWGRSNRRGSGTRRIWNLSISTLGIWISQRDLRTRTGAAWPEDTRPGRSSRTAIRSASRRHVFTDVSRATADASSAAFVVRMLSTSHGIGRENHPQGDTRNPQPLAQASRCYMPGHAQVPGTKPCPAPQVGRVTHMVIHRARAVASALGTADRRGCGLARRLTGVLATGEIAA